MAQDQAKILAAKTFTIPTAGPGAPEFKIAGVGEVVTPASMPTEEGTAHVMHDLLLTGYRDATHTCGEINVLELRAVLLAPRANRHQLHGQHTPPPRSDNSCVIAIVAKHASRSGTVMATYRGCTLFCSRTAYS